MENLNVKFTWEQIWKQSWSEWDLKNMIPLLEERFKEIIKPKDTVTDYDKAEWQSSVIHVIYQLLPPRYFIRFIEEENHFVFQFVDSSRTQESQSIKVPYRKVFDWKIGSWEEAKQVPTKEERRKLLSYWKENGYSVTDIINHFGTSSAVLYRWTNSECCNLANGKRRCRDANHPANVAALLRRAGMKSVSDSLIAQTCNCSFKTAVTATRRRVVDEDLFHEIDYERAIEYMNLFICRLTSYGKHLGSGELDPRGRLIGKSVRVATGITVTNKRSYNPVKKWYTPTINQEKFKEAISYLNNVLTNLNKMKGELK